MRQLRKDGTLYPPVLIFGSFEAILNFLFCFLSAAYPGQKIRKDFPTFRAGMIRGRGQDGAVKGGEIGWLGRMLTAIEPKGESSAYGPFEKKKDPTPLHQQIKNPTRRRLSAPFRAKF